MARLQFSFGTWFYLTLFAATMVAMKLTPVPWAFIYPAGFILVVSVYVVWSIRRGVKQAFEVEEKSIMEEWDELKSENSDSV